MLIIRPNVKLNGALCKVLMDLAPHTGDAKVEITSGLREPLDQLRVIGWYAINKGVSFPEFDVHDLYGKKVIDGQELYSWQRTWSRLLNLGVIINPPLSAVCLEDSKRPDGSNRKGVVIHGSPHGRGVAVDVSANAGYQAIVFVLEQAKKAGVAIKDWLIERENNCVHLNISLDPEKQLVL